MSRTSILILEKKLVEKVNNQKLLIIPRVVEGLMRSFMLPREDECVCNTSNSSCDH